MAARRTLLRGRLAGPFFMLTMTVAVAQSQPPSKALPAEHPATEKPATEQPAAPMNLARPEIKCRAYTALWDRTIAARGYDGIGPAFLERHAAFIAGGCTGGHDVCPRSPAELDLANIMVLHSMNAGMASTFAPFGCPK